MINVITETRRRLEYLRKELEELKNFDNTAKISGTAKEHIHDEISKTEANIKYYYEILEKMEERYMNEVLEEVTNNKELWSAFIEFQKEFKGMKPDATNPFFKSTYITLDGILETVRPILAKQGLAVMQESTGDGEYISVKTRLVHITGQNYETETLTMKPKQNDPQQLGSCITYAKRYQLAALLGICESIDDDGNSATFGNKKPNEPKKQDNKETPKQENKVYKCADCQKETPENVAKFSYSKYKKILCMDCQKKQ